jgi:hypothetical protein
MAKKRDARPIAAARVFCLRRDTVALREWDLGSEERSQSSGKAEIIVDSLNAYLRTPSIKERNSTLVMLVMPSRTRRSRDLAK